ncbi:MAG TPA: hypothetical protein PKD90_12860 [Phnomibacter sp.]|nr:hypothetical protein [Phnomibacter sp.]
MQPPHLIEVVEAAGHNTALLHQAVWQQQLQQAINHLLQHNFAALVQVLYRADIPEQALRQALQQQAGTPAATIIANMLVQRLQQQQAARAATPPVPPGVPEEDRW